MLDWDAYVKIFIGIVVIVNPLGLAPAFLSLTANRPSRQVAGIARTAAISALIILLTAAVAGTSILDFFGISLEGFRVAGGLLLLFVGMDMLHARQSRHQQTPEESEEAQGKDSVGVVPLAIPLLAGPASMSTVVLYAHESDHWEHVLVVCAIVAVVCLLVWICFTLAERIGTLLGQTGINIFTRLMGLILVALAIEFMTKGLGKIFPGWAG